MFSLILIYVNTQQTEKQQNNWHEHTQRHTQLNEDAQMLGARMHDTAGMLCRIQTTHLMDFKKDDLLKKRRTTLVEFQKGAKNI